MRFLADENCDMAAVRALRGAGHDVTLVRDQAPGANDEEVMKLALSEGRILLTEDKDFGQLVRAGSAQKVGVVLLRFPALARASMGPMLLQAVGALSIRLESAFTVIEPGRFRISGSSL
jgi:predicted nuclease of predicted toxin-antitoxin system